MQKSDHVIVADLSLSLPLGQRPYLGRAHPLGHHDGVVPHVGGIGHSARLRRLSASAFPPHPPAPNPERHLIPLRRNPHRRGRQSAAKPHDDLLPPAPHLPHL